MHSNKPQQVAKARQLARWVRVVREGWEEKGSRGGIEWAVRAERDEVRAAAELVQHRRSGGAGLQESDLREAYAPPRRLEWWCAQEVARFLRLRVDGDAREVEVRPAIGEARDAAASLQGWGDAVVRAWQLYRERRW